MGQTSWVAEPKGSTVAAYDALAERLERIVSRNVTAPTSLIEEACQVAWSLWLTRRDAVSPAGTLGWLATTATREALRMLRSHAHEVPLDHTVSGAGVVVELPARDPGPDEMVELRERLAEVRQLPVRQQRIVWLKGLGYDYAEIGRRTGDSRRTVERQLLRARRKLTEPS